MVSDFYPMHVPSGTKGDHVGVVMTDGLETDVKQEFMIDEDITTITSVYVILVPNGTGNLDWSCTTDWFQVNAGEQYNNGSDSTSGTTAVTNGEGEAIDITAAFTGATGGDIIGLVFTRDGDDASDTVSADVTYLGVYVEGT